jgi:hypothetical protein
MADQSISQLPIATTLTGSELVPIVQNGITKQTQVNNLANAVSPGKLITSAGIAGNSILFQYSDGTSSTTSQVVATATSGTTTTLPFGSSATVTNVGSTANAVFNFAIPAGPGFATGGTTGQLLAKASNADYDTTWVNQVSGTVTSVSGSGGITGLTLTGGPITSSGTLTLGGTLAVANGGTGVTTSSGANSVVLRDANGNVSTNSIFDAFSVIAATTPIVLTASSIPNYVITGSGGQTISLPSALTLPVGAAFTFNNNQTSGIIDVKNNSGTSIISGGIPSGGYAFVELLTNSNAAGTWDYHFQAPSNVLWSTNTFNYPGSITGATWNGNTVQVNRGGTGTTTSTGSGNVVLSTSPTLVTPVLGTPTSVTLTNATGLPIGGITATGTPSSTTYLRGDSTWSTIPSSMVYPGAGIPNSTGSAWGTSYGVTGTGSVVLSNSPTLTGNVSANVNLRSGTLSSLLALAGGVSEIGYATDVNSLVRFNGNANGAVPLGSYTNGSTLNYVVNTDAEATAIVNGTTIIDCKNISVLNLILGPNVAAVITNINIRLPSGLANTPIASLKINFIVNPVGAGGAFLPPLTIITYFQPSDVTALGSDILYNQTIPDVATTTVGTIGVASSASATLNSNVITFTAGGVARTIGQELSFSDGTSTFPVVTRITGIISNTQITVSQPAIKNSTGLTLTGLSTTSCVARINYNFADNTYNLIPTIEFNLAGSYGWTRYPMPLESANAGGGYTAMSGVGLLGEKITGTKVNSGNPVTLSNNTVVNLSSFTLTPGIWMLYGYIAFAPSVGFSSSLLAAATGLIGTSASPLGGGLVNQITSATGTSLQYPIATSVITVGGTGAYFGNAYATITSGTVTAVMNMFAVRIA